MITPVQLKAVFPACRNPGVWVRAIGQMVAEFELDQPQRLAMFVAQCGFESESFNVTREIMSYSTVAKLRAVYPREFPTDEAAQPYVINPSALANFVYANKDGNGDVASNDGFRYRGGGLIQLTGRANYKAAGEALGLDLEQRPMQILIETVAARTAGYFWKLKDLNAAADAGDFDHTTRAINGTAMRGADERRVLWQKLVAQLGAPTPTQAAVAARQTMPADTTGLANPELNSQRSLNNFNT